jgi:hypothetical protein
MHKQWRLIVRCALAGLAVAILVFAYLSFNGEFNSTLYSACAILCPPSLLCIPFSDAMKSKAGMVAVWLIIGLANTGLYAAIGAAIGSVT